MSGYDYQAGMSNNAVNAYDRGVKPLSRITAQDLKDAGISITLKRAKELAKSGHWQPQEWHHSGGTWYNEVNFYGVEELAEMLEEDPELAAPVSSGVAAKEQERCRVRGTYKIWGGSRRHPKVVGEESFTGTKKGDWIHLDGGGKKKASGNHINWEIIEEI